jgi:hypothetical protein
VGGVLHVGIESGLIGEAHDSAECVALAAWGDVGADVGFKQAGDASLEGSNVVGRFFLLGVRGSGFHWKAKT